MIQISQKVSLSQERNAIAERKNTHKTPIKYPQNTHKTPIKYPQNTHKKRTKYTQNTRKKPKQKKYTPALPVNHHTWGEGLAGRGAPPPLLIGQKQKTTLHEHKTDPAHFLPPTQKSEEPHRSHMGRRAAGTPLLIGQKQKTPFTE